MKIALRVIIPLAALAALIAALLTAALRTPSPRSYDIGAPGDAYVALNFYAPEDDRGTTFRWSGPDAALLLPDPYAGAAIISARLHGNPDLAPLSLYASGPSGRILTIKPDVGWRVYRILAPRDMLWDASGQPAQLNLSAAPSRPQTGDPRELGVALDALRVTPITIVGAPIGPPLRHALLLTWAIALITAALWMIARSLAAQRSGTKAGSMLLGIPLLLAAGIVLWAARDSASLGWALPLDAPGLGVATCVLAGLWAGEQLLPRRLAITSRAGAISAIALAAIAHLLLLPQLGVELRGLAALIIIGMPGTLLALLLLPDLDDPLERTFFGLCGGLAMAVLLPLALQVVPATISPWPLLIICDAQSAIVGLALLRRPHAPRPTPHAPHPYLPLSLILIIATALRLPFLGLAELHDDEATAVVAAARMVGGEPSQLLIQLKGPVQVLLPVGPMALTGQINEWVARMPFLLAGMGVVLGGYLLARRLLGGAGAWAGLAVAAILACDGFLIAFSRIVQYQSVVMIMVIGAFWCCWRFYQGAARPGPDLIAAAIMMAVALLSHYDAIYVGPALAWLVVAGGMRRGWRARQWAGALAGPIALGGGLLASFYLPFVLHPHFSEAVNHIGERSGQQQGAGWVLYNNLRGSYLLATFYNTTPAVSVAAAGLAITLALALVAYVRPRPLGYLLAGLILVASADLLRGPGGSLLMLNSWLAAAAIGLPIVALSLSRATPIALRAPLIWFGAAFISISFLLEQPRTHMHVMDVPAALLIGSGIAALGRATSRPMPWLRSGLAAIAVALVIIAAPYAYTLFVRQSPEYQRSFPMAAIPAYPARGTEDPSLTIGGSGRLGYPTQDGWKAVGELYRSGVLSGPFASNQSTEVAGWYTRGLMRCNARPEYYIIAMSLTNPAIPANYQLFGMIQVAGRNQLLIYSRQPRSAPPQIFDGAQFLSAFDRQPIPRLPTAETGCPQGSPSG